MIALKKPITHLSWGKILIDLKGKKYEFKDCKIWPEEAKNWDWGVTGTSHDPGIQPSDIDEILDHNIDVMVLATGMEMRMKVSPETEDRLKNLGIDYHIENTERAAELFNSLFQQGKRIGGIFHSTC